MDSYTNQQSSHKEPTTIEGYLQSGWASHAQGNPQSAEDDFRKVLTMEPSSFEASYGLALAIKSQGRLEEARELFQQTIFLLKDEILEKDTARTTMLRSMAEAQLRMLNKSHQG